MGFFQRVPVNDFYKPKLKLKDMMARGLLKKFLLFLAWLLKDHIFRSLFLYLSRAKWRIPWGRNKKTIFFIKKERKKAKGKIMRVFR